jgi:hypothetical protein
MLDRIDSYVYGKAPTSFNIDNTGYGWQLPALEKLPSSQPHNHNGKMDELERKKNQKEFREILAKYGITQAQAADLITKKTNQEVSTRKVRSWLANLEAHSARNLPNWAITALKEATIDLEVHEQKEN